MDMRTKRQCFLSLPPNMSMSLRILNSLFEREIKLNFKEKRRIKTLLYFRNKDDIFRKDPYNMPFN